jgi:hypothetical protein
MNNFSDITFKLLRQWSEKYHQNPLGIYNSDEYDDFITYVEQPFIEFCQVLSRKLPAHLAAPRVEHVAAMNGHMLEELIVIESTKYDDTKLRLQEYFSPVLLLYVELNSVSIIGGCSGNIYNSLFKNISQKHPDALLELISINPAILIQTRLAFHVLKEDAVRESFDELSNKFLRFFSQYLPLILLANSDDPMPAIRQYLAPPNPQYPLNQCEENTGFEKAELERWVREIDRKGQAILHGSSGTGKTYIAEQLAEHLIGSGNGFKELVQFHPAYMEIEPYLEEYFYDQLDKVDEFRWDNIKQQIRS